MTDPTPLDPTPGRRGPTRAFRILLGGVVGLLAAVALHAALGRPAPPPAAIAGDPVLVRGYEIYSARCVGCHGAAGKGDGRLVAGLAGPKPRNLVEEEWKYGDAPEQVVAVIERGAEGSTMPGYGGIYGRTALNDVAAYTYHLAGKSIPAKLRVP